MDCRDTAPSPLYEEDGEPRRTSYLVGSHAPRWARRAAVRHCTVPSVVYAVLLVFPRRPACTADCLRCPPPAATEHCRHSYTTPRSMPPDHRGWPHCVALGARWRLTLASRNCSHNHPLTYSPSIFLDRPPLRRPPCVAQCADGQFVPTRPTRVSIDVLYPVPGCRGSGRA